MKKHILFLLAFLITAFSVSSCNFGGSNGNDEKNENCVWGAGVSPYILLDDYSKENIDVSFWLDEFYRLTGSNAAIIGKDHMQRSHEIIVGDFDRDISKKAYLRLERLLEDAEISEPVGFVICSDGTSLAIAYDHPLALIEAINYFNENLLIKASLAPTSEIITSEIFNVEEYVEAAREARRDKELDALIPEIGEDAVNALKKMFGLYTDGLYKWLADLYDKDIGGFYACNSGRDTEDFLPDIQSTWQIVSFLSQSGLTDGYENIRDAIPEEIGEQILAYALSLQSSEDGYFYHPQWGKDISTARLGRDLSWATEIISIFGGKPIYDTPNGHKGSLGAPGQNAAASHLTSRLSTSTVVAVSKVELTSKESLPSYLKSIEAWDVYIKGLIIPYNSYNAGNTLAAQHSQIKFAGDEYVDYLISYLNSIQNPNTALWEAYDSDHDEYYAVNGLMKLSSLYNSFGKPLPNADAALESCMTIALKPDGDTYVCSIYNPWITMYYILLCTERSEGQSRAEELRAIVLSSAADLIEATMNKIADYRLPDGGFATYGKDGDPINIMTGALVGCATKPECDVDATTIASVGIICNIFNVLGCTEVKLYGKEDYIVFKERWLDLGSIIKMPYMNSIVPETFDEYDPSYFNIDGGVIFDPGKYVQNDIGDYETDGKNYKWFSSAIVEDPSPSSNGDLALRAESFLYEGTDKTKANEASSTYFGIQGVVRNENCYVFDGDIYFERTEGATCVGEIFFVSSINKGDASVGLTILKYTANGKTYFSIGEGYEGLDGTKDGKIVTGIPSEEWVRLRIEVYKTETSGNIDIKCKIYVNGTYRGTCDAGYSKNGKFVDRNIAAVRYSHYRHSASVVYFDNVAVQAINKEFVYEDDYTSESSGPKKVDFEDYMTYGETTFIHAPTPVSSGAGFAVQSVVGADGKETLAYVYDSNVGGADSFRLQSYGIDAETNLTSANAFTYEADMKFDFNTEAQSTQVKLNIGSTSSSSYNAYYMLISLDNMSGRLKLSDIGANTNGSSVVTDVKNGDWFNIRVEYYYIADNEMLVLTYINKKLVYVSNNYNSSNANDSNAWPVFDADGYKLPSGKEISGVEKIMFTAFEKADVTIYLDNCIVRRMNLTAPKVEEGDYTSRYDKDMSDNVDDGGSGDVGNSGGNTDGSSSGTNPSDGDIIGNLPNDTWKE